MKIRIFIAIALASLLAACATPQQYPRLERARAEVQKAQMNPIVAQYAPSALAQAQDALARAEASLSADRPVQTEHLAYLAERRAQIAVLTARTGQAQEIAKEANIEQRQSLESQASSAHQQAAQAQVQAQTARQQADVAQAQAVEARAQAAQAHAEARQTRSELQQLQTKLANLHPKKTPQGIVLTLGDVLFDFDKSDLKPSANPTLNELAQFLNNHPDAQVVINGYTDSVGSETYNQRLSEARAESVAGALEQRGISSARMTTHGFGESNPIATNATNEGRTKNRRVEFVIKNLQG
ncbi:MAG TPA: OmpA family protein [Gammaproteobacteria bacterium]|nr:OmpA family protein [Gammaproteobacteria bacterium]